MKNNLSKFHKLPHLRIGVWLRRRVLAILTAIAAFSGLAGLSLVTSILVVACGGGSNVAGVGSGGTGTLGVYNVGTITGFGSVFVNGVRFDDTSASVSDDDGSRSLADLRLGMVVRVQGSVNANGSATASSFAFDSELLGPVRSLNAASKTLVVLGQTVAIDANTVFDSSLPAGLASVQLAQTLEVHGYLDASANLLQATFVERKNEPNRYKLRGIVSNLQSAARTFQIGQESISFDGISGNDIAPNLANGQLVKVQLVAAAPNSSGQQQAARLRSGNRDTPSDSRQVEIEGLVSAVTTTAQFSINGTPVDARNATFPNGSAGLAVGARVEVEGSLVAGTLVATEVELKISNGNRGSGSSGGGDDGSQSDDANSINTIKLDGPISNLDTAARTFVVRGVVVSFAGAVQYDDGSAADLVNGANVQIEGQTSIASSIITATRIEFD